MKAPLRVEAAGFELMTSGRMIKCERNIPLDMNGSCKFD